MYKKTTFVLRALLFVVFTSLNILAQTNSVQLATGGYWQATPENQLVRKGIRDLYPQAYQTYTLRLQQFTKALSAAPLQAYGANRPNPLTVALPMPDGSMQRYALVESPVMHPDLAARFPENKTWTGQGIDDPTATMRCSITQFGFRAMIIGNQGTIYIDPYGVGDLHNYIVFNKADFYANNDLGYSCETNDSHFADDYHPNTETPAYRSNGVLRTYRAAFACSKEFTNTHCGGTQSGGLAKVVEVINRLNTIYERDLSIHLEMVANSIDIVYTNTNTPPVAYSTSDHSANNDANQTNVDTDIGSANYDVGHALTTVGGGLAWLGVFCNGNDLKAKGTSGTGGWSTGDPFMVDIVSHEVGHMLGAGHTFNSNAAGNCGPNRSETTAWEPGSGSTPMSYSGLCGGGHDIQSNSDDYFHSGSINQILNTINGSGGCASFTNVGNADPTCEAGPNYTIPKSTPFMLTGTSNDINGNGSLTHCWEELDLGPGGHPNSPVGQAPIFRSFYPTASKTRVFPKWSDILNNTQTTGEIMASYGRTISLNFFVRDNFAGCGGADVDNMVVTVDDVAGPFVVTAPNTAVTWEIGQTQNVTWNVAGTTAAPVSCANVDIYLSTNGGTEWPMLLASNVPNDGTHPIVVPNAITTQARVMVKGRGNIFFDVSNVNFTINASSVPTYLMEVANDTVNVCAPSDGTFTVNLTSFTGFNSPVTLSASGNPPGTVVTFSPNPVTPTGSSTMTISNTGGLADKSIHSFTVSGTGGSITRTQSVAIQVSQGAVPELTATYPNDGNNNVPLAPTFSWTSSANALSYDFQLATDAIFANIIASTNTTATSYNTGLTLTPNTVYYWRVRGNNYCGNGPYTDAAFATYQVICQTFNSTDVPKNIPTTGSNTPINSTLNIGSSFTLTDVNVVNIAGTHTFYGDMTMRLKHPDGTVIVLSDVSFCEAQDNFGLGYDDEAASPPPCVPLTGLYTPFDPLSDLDGKTSIGNWTFQIYDFYNGDGGTLTAWGLELCYTAPSNQDFGTALVVQIKALLQGPYNAGTDVMSTALRAANLLPISQPFNGLPWAYVGTESVASPNDIPANITDWVIIELRAAGNKNTLVTRKACWLRSDGMVVDLDGTPGVKFSGTPPGNYYVVVRDRTHLDAISANAVALPNGITLDFTNPANVSGGAAQLGLLEGATYGLLCGDYDGNGKITIADFNKYNADASKLNGYYPGDGNLDKNVTITDFNLYNANASKLGVIEIQY